MLAFVFVQGHPIVTPYAHHAALAIASVTGPERASQFGVEELKVAADGTYDNPFDPDDVSLSATVTPPSGASYDLPGFLYRAYDRKLNGENEVLTAAGNPDWRLRICPTEPGHYKVAVQFKDRTGTTTKSFEFDSDKTADPGFVKVSPRDHHYFEFGNGTSYFPIGANICWGNSQGTFSYDDWLPNYGKNGANYERLWLGPHWVTFALEKSGKAADGAGMGQFDLGNAWRLDYVLDEAARNGIYTMLCFDSYNELRVRDAYPEWERTPQNSSNGGPLRSWTDFWTNPEMDRFYRNKLRYLVARYSAFTHVLSWEFWNEVDLVQDFDREAVRSWHQRMGDVLRNLDPYHHLVTTSFADSMGDRDTYLLKELDYSQTHLYNPNLASLISYQVGRRASWGKPHYIGEVGADAAGPRDKEDQIGLQVHDPLWVSLTTGAAGGGMPWWWDSLIAPHNLYSLFGAFSSFARGIDFPREGFRPNDATLAFADPKTPATKGDLVIESGNASWQPGPDNVPQTISVSGGKLDGPRPAGLLHGTRNHPNLHNPLTINIREPNPTTFEIDVGEVSTYGGAALRVTLDGSVYLTKSFDAGENNKQPDLAHKFDGIYSVQIPAGIHTLVVENPGNDWFRAGYRFVGVVSRVGPALNLWALAGNDIALAWLNHIGRNWQAVVVQKRTFAPVPPSVLTLTGLAQGTWRAELWDTWTGKIVGTQAVSVGLDGNARVRLPSITVDLAVKLSKGGVK
ncbi:MAG TPA: DUF5060 domain-containing protein [Fimbriimonas sp.]|nr:DUF5060 domain-containing protein [Fimbriimonas sp.]